MMSGNWLKCMIEIGKISNKEVINHTIAFMTASCYTINVPFGKYNLFTQNL
jgi:hypothetical protein